jgi:thiosulfate reductase cytochrome b subunit
VWRDEWDRIVHIVAASGAAGFVVGAVRIVISYRYETKLQWLAVMCGTVFIAVITGLLVADTDLSPAWASAVIGLSAFVADNLILALLTIAKSVGANPLRAIRRIMAAVRGLPPPTDSDRAPLK